jgi:hypothetical protein
MIMALRWMADASVPPASRPQLYAVAGYIGGDTPRVWTPDDWAGQPADFRLPIFTAANREDIACAAGEDAWEIRAALGALGVHVRFTVAVDIETRVYGTYLKALDAFLAPRPLMVYGSFDSLLRNPLTSGGRWAAEWGHGILPAEQDIGTHGIRAFQWADAARLGRDYDLSVIESDVPLWPRGPVPAAQEGGQLAG